MTREEEIDAMARHYTDNLPAEIDRFCKENMYSAYVVGAMWADLHPKNVWHDTDDMPKSNSWILIQEDKGGYDTLKIVSDNVRSNWVLTCKVFSIYKWAYIEDLFPKGGER